MTREEALQIIYDRCQHCEETEKAFEVLKENKGECICIGSVHVDDMGRYDPYTDSFVRGDKE